MYVFMPVCVCACVFGKYITTCVGTLCDLFCAYAMSFDRSICFYIIMFHRDIYERVSVQMCAYVFFNLRVFMKE